jgi:hypothetical protein
MKSPLMVLAETGVPLLLVGGTAVQCYGIGRFTKDFDCLIADDTDPILAPILVAAGFEEFRRNHVVVRYRHIQQITWVLDTLLTSRSSFEKMWAERRSQPFAGATLQLAAPHHIIGMKLHAMKHNASREMFDLLDCLELIKLQRHTFSRDELAAMCERYGTPETNAKLLAAYDR